MPNILRGERKVVPIDIPPDELEDLKQYLDETFTAVDITAKDDQLMSAPKPDLLTLCRLFHPGIDRPGSIYDGRGWNDLFAEKLPVEESKFLWVDVYGLNEFAEETALNEDCTYSLWFCKPGLLHVEVDDDGTWTARDILALPYWMRLG